jgi:hypothetical protein
MKDTTKNYLCLSLVIVTLIWGVKDISNIISSYDGVMGVCDYAISVYKKYNFSGVAAIQGAFFIFTCIVFFREIKKTTKVNPWLTLPDTSVFFSHTFWGTVVYFLVFSIGIYFSIISSSVNNWLNPSGKSAIVFEYQNSFSWVVTCLLLSIILYIHHHLSVSKVHKKREQNQGESYNNKLDKLQGIIELSPPGDFSQDFAKYVDIAEDFASKISSQYRVNNVATQFLDKIGYKVNTKKGYKDIKGNVDISLVIKNKDELLAAISSFEQTIENQASYVRAILIAYTRLAAFFDGKKPSNKLGSIYRANIMTKHSNVDKVMPNNFRYVYELAKGKEESFINLYLELKRMYSVKVNTDKKNIISLQTEEFKPLDFLGDTEIEEMSLPFFVDANKRQYNCFGAPRAIVEAECQFIDDTYAEVLGWGETLQPGKEIIDEAKKYFFLNSKARSIISIPLQLNRYHENHSNHKHVLGVVNIYCDSANLMMGKRKKQEQFTHITTPLNSSLARIMSINLVMEYYLNVLKEIQKHANISTNEEDKSVKNMKKAG